MYIETLTFKYLNDARACSYAHKSLSHALVFVAGLSVFGISESLVAAGNNPVVIRGLRHSNAEQSILDSAIKSANLMTKAEVRERQQAERLQTRS